MKIRTLLIAGGSVFLFGIVSQAEIKVVTERNERDAATLRFRFKDVPSPVKEDAAKDAKFTLVDGTKDANGADLDKLHDGRVAREEDQPSESFFFDAGTDGGRILVDLGSVIEIKKVNTFSWHGGSRGPQVYKVYGSEGSSADFSAQPKKQTDPKSVGWSFVGAVDTRPERSPFGGQYGVSISDSKGAIGKYRYLLFDISRTEQSDGFGNTFFTEIDVIDKEVSESAEVVETKTIRKTFEAAEGKYQITMDTSLAPDLTEWAEAKLAPVTREWYPKIVKMLPSDGYEAPTKVAITFREGMGKIPASAGRGGINCNIDWFRKNLKGEAVGSVVHEMVHVVQQYGRARATNPNATRTPGWIVEGIPDYIRWFLYEPQTKGAEITARNVAKAKYDASYRVTGNFLNWVTEKYDKDLVVKLNAAAREGKYSEELWKNYTGKPLADLGDEWKKGHEVRLAALAEKNANTIGDDQRSAGWKLLFNGKDLTGWHNFRTNTIKPGWQVKEGTLACVDPHNAGDLCTDDQFEWFELQLDYNISEGGNSGIMYHVTDEARSAWAPGPEFQLEDNAKAADPQRCGWLYALYQPPNDPKTGKPLDATKPAGEWNHVRLLISPEKCEHEINGVKYFDYVLGSEDFKERVAKSKFSKMPLFAKPNKGYITLQGDHGQVSFRNIKVRVIEPK